MKNSTKISLCLLALLLLTLPELLSQTAVVKGKVIDRNNLPIADVNIEVVGMDIRSRSDADGSYRLEIPAGEVVQIRFTHAAHSPAQLELRLMAGRVYDRPVSMLERQLDEFEITDEQSPTSLHERPQMQRIPIRSEEIIKMPGFNRSIEAIMKTQAGVVSNNEFSSQYQVRGGNFDENLVYVNGIEIYRPFLARTGQQEGLGFSNPDMAQNIQFSTGGFAAEYGDRLSSVLDITYRTPREFRATLEAGIITNNIHFEGISRNKKSPDKPGRFTYQLGARRFSNSYPLNSLETDGEYKPNFVDLQLMLTFTPQNRLRQPRYRQRKNGQRDTLYYANSPWKFTTFGALTRNRYLFSPDARESTFGTIKQAFRIRVAFDGQQETAYTTGMLAFKAEHRPHARLSFDYILSGFQTEESEVFDVYGQYLLGEVNTSFGSSEFNETEFDLGIGTEFNHGRNYLTAKVGSGQIRGLWTLNNQGRHKLRFGLKGVYRLIEDDLKEFTIEDSAGYVIDSTGKFGVEEYIRGATRLENRQLKAFVQHEWQLNKSRSLLLISGLRAINYRFNIQPQAHWLYSPRLQFVYDASARKGGPNLRLRLASGIYHQLPFYREFRRFDGSINAGVQPQTSVHFIAGLDHQFTAWGRPFKFFSEVYYKKLSNLIPYEVQNIRIRYYPDRLADGFAYGLDARINGEFIKGVDSWVSLGLLKTSEDIRGDDQGPVPRPTDQRVTFAMYFQDELPTNPTFKVHINYIFGSGMRFGPPRTFDRRTEFAFPAYHRVDIGFSKLITFRGSAERIKHGIESIWATAEIYNLFQRQNTVSHIWIKDLQNNRYAVPNHLSDRLFNIRIVARFR